MSRLLMDKDTVFMTINTTLIYWGGGTFAQVLFDLLIKTNDLSHTYEQPRFFQPYTTKEDLLKIYSPITAPVTFLFLAAEMAFGFMVGSIMTLMAACNFNGSEITENAGITGKCLLNILIFSVAAVLSPLVNLVDVMGSLFTTAIDGYSNSDTEDAFYLR